MPFSMRETTQQHITLDTSISYFVLLLYVESAQTHLYFPQQKQTNMF